MGGAWTARGAPRSSEPISHAYRLAFFLHRDETRARRIVLSALLRLETACAKQARRTYYQPKNLRTKVVMSRPQLLQHLVCRESEPHERSRERRGNPDADAEDRLVWFVKHLVQLTTARSSFYVALGLCRLLYRYSTEETMAIYDLVTQDPSCRCDDDYFRARKRVLMGNLRQRFGDLPTRRGPRGETRFQATEPSARLATLVSQCLETLTPWETRCTLPESFSPWTEELAELRSEGSDPDGWHRAEMNRMHTLLHPTCFAKLTRGLGLEPPENRLTVPCLGSTSHPADPAGERFPAPELEAEDSSSWFDLHEVAGSLFFSSV